MISPPGVLIPAEWCAEVGQHLGRSLKLDHISSPKLLEFVDELTAVGVAVSDASDNGSRGLSSLPDLPHTPGMTVKTYADHRGLSERRVRQMCQTGDLDCHKQGHQWLIRAQEGNT